MAGAETESSPPAPTATTLPTADVQAPAEADADDDLPDMPPEAPVPPVIDTVDTSASATDTSAAAPIAVAAPAAAVSPQPTRLPRQVPPPVGVTQPGWFPAGPGGAELTAADFGFDARQYGADPALFSYRLACAARLVVSGVPNTACVDLFRYLDSEGVFERYYAKKRSFEERLGATDGAAFWYAREMTTLELWETVGMAGSLMKKVVVIIMCLMATPLFYRYRWGCTSTAGWH